MILTKKKMKTTICNSFTVASPNTANIYLLSNAIKNNLHMPQYYNTTIEITLIY